MAMEPVDYTAILNDLEAKKNALEQTIASFRQAMAAGALGQISEGGTVPSMYVSSSFGGGEVPTGAFLGKSIPEAAKLYLEIVKKKQTTKEIMDALKKGGMESTAKSLLKTVHAALTRARQAPNPSIVKVGTQWGLTGWFPKGITNGGTRPKKANKKNPKKRAAKPTIVSAPKSSATTKGPSLAATYPPFEKEPSPNTKLVVEMLWAKIGNKFSVHEIAKETKVDVQNVNRIVANLVRGGRAEHNQGKYWATIHTEPVNGQAVA